MTETRKLGTRVLDYVMGRTRSDIDQNEAGRENIQRNDDIVQRSMDKATDTHDKVVSAVNEFSVVLAQLAKDLGYEDKRKVKAHAKAPGRSNKT